MCRYVAAATEEAADAVSFAASPEIDGLTADFFSGRLELLPRPVGSQQQPSRKDPPTPENGIRLHEFSRQKVFTCSLAKAKTEHKNVEEA